MAGESQPAAGMRVAAIDVSHWHARYDAAWLPVFRDLGATFVGMSDPNGEIASDHAEQFGGKAFTDYRAMVEETKPDFVVALGRHIDMPERIEGDAALFVRGVVAKPPGDEGVRRFV